MAEEPLSQDEELEIAFQMMEGDSGGLVRLLQAFGPRVKWLLMRKFEGLLDEQDVDGILNFAAHKAWKAVGGYDYQKCGLGGWFYVIAYHTAVDELRGGETVRSAGPLESEPGLTPREPACIAEDNEDANIDELLRCIDDLGDIQQTIVKADLAAGGEADGAWLAKKLGIPKQNVYSYRNKAREALLKRMTKRGHTANTIRRNR